MNCPAVGASKAQKRESVCVPLLGGKLALPVFNQKRLFESRGAGYVVREGAVVLLFFFFITLEPISESCTSL